MESQDRMLPFVFQHLDYQMSLRQPKQPLFAEYMPPRRGFFARHEDDEFEDNADYGEDDLSDHDSFADEDQYSEQEDHDASEGYGAQPGKGDQVQHAEQVQSVLTAMHGVLTYNKCRTTVNGVIETRLTSSAITQLFNQLSKISDTDTETHLYLETQLLAIFTILIINTPALADEFFAANILRRLRQLKVYNDSFVPGLAGMIVLLKYLAISSRKYMERILDSGIVHVVWNVALRDAGLQIASARDLIRIGTASSIRSFLECRYVQVEELHFSVPLLAEILRYDNADFLYDACVATNDFCRTDHRLALVCKTTIPGLLSGCYSTPSPLSCSMRSV
ncbi:hypothetical protein K470DRAFT_262383 [Piedraia hortae CBS 480.64]|uniref:Uncharacterized protein n=1 Tax=Piedraia hortae CBS 480.64 TaxID=1314780 RepID=A0A6A7C667_9PEZI|nr:hypothetical protein K470DRAFT_262383 [Piedraia hortae CBS 480.64]